MNCREFDQRWGDLFDARPEAADQIERGLDAHASNCARCRAASDRNHLLRQAIADLRPPVPSPGSIDRLYALTVTPARSTIAMATARPRRRLRRPLATAAAVALAWFGGNCWPNRQPAEVDDPGKSVTLVSIAPPRPLGLTLAVAAQATLDLARKTSEPASRFSRDFLKLGRPGRPPADPAPEVDADAEPADSAASGLIRAVGAGIKPISGSAQHAFSFLLGRPDETAPAPSPDRRGSL